MVDRKTIAYYPGYLVQNRIINAIYNADIELAKINSYLRSSNERSMSWEVNIFFNLVNIVYCSLIDKVHNIKIRKGAESEPKYAELLTYKDFFMGDKNPADLKLGDLKHIYSLLREFAEEYQLMNIEHKDDLEDNVDFLVDGSLE